MSYFPPRDTGSSSRPTLPPIRDLFHDELSRDPNAPHESPSLTLARLRVTDDDEYESSTRIASGMPRPSEPPYYPPSGHSDPSLGHHQYNAYGHPHIDPHSPRIGHPSSSQYHSSPITYPQASHREAHIVSRPHAPPMSYTSASMSAPERSLHSHHRDTHPHSYRHHNSPEAPHPYGYSNPPIARHRSDMSLSVSDPSLRPWTISTNVQSDNAADDDERTPVARYNTTTPMGVPGTIGYYPVDDFDAANMSSKYDCPYCGKGFNRPSSLKIHLNSHTGEKPFVCPVESCGRSFSVLSNMRRHARVHNIPSLQESGNEMPFASSSALPSSSSQGRWSHRRDSSASGSSTSSQRSRSTSPNDEDEGSEKRTPPKIA